MSRSTTAMPAARARVLMVLRVRPSSSAALTGVVMSYRPRSALRDVGRALGLDLERIAAYCKKDVVATTQLFLRLTGKPLIAEADIALV